MMKRYFIVLIGCLFSVIVNSQKAQLFLGNVPSQNAIEIKWMGREIKAEDSYDLYRKENGGSWNKINNAPIKRITPLNTAEIKKETEKNPHDEALLIYSTAFQKDDTGETNSEMNYFVLNILSATQNDLAKYMGQYFIDNTVSPDKNYEYRLTLSGKSAESFITTSNIIAKAYQQPASPADFSALAKDKLVQFKWTPDKKFSQYRIYATATIAKSDRILTALLSEEQVKEANAGKYFFQDKDSLLQNGKTYRYKICGVDFFGHESKLSQEIEATPKDLTPPAAVYGFKTELKDKAVLLRWMVSKEADCTGYNVYKSTKAKEGFVKMNTALISKTESTYTDKDVKEGLQYFYYLEAVDKNENGAKTEVVSYSLPDMTPPSVPKNLKATSETGKINLIWDKNTESDIEGYYVFRALKNEESNFQLLNSEPLKVNSFIDKLPKEAGNYFLYRVCAVDKNYNRSNPTTYIAARMPDVVAPIPVTLISADWKASQVKLQWTQNHESDCKGYEIWRAETDTDLKAINPQIITPLLINNKTVSYSDEKAPAGKAILYYIVVVDSTGNHSVASNKKLLVPMKTTEGLNAAISNLRGIYNAVSKTINLSWTEAMAQNIQGYKVYRKTGLGSYIPVSGIKKATTFTDTTITIGNNYMYKILSVSADGEDSYSNEIKVETK